MADPTFGIGIQTIDSEVRPPSYGDMSVVGLIGTAPNADANIFPFNTPVFMYSDDADKLTALGVSGTLSDAIRLLHAQLGEFQVAAKVVVVRISQDVDDQVTIGRIAGNGVTTGAFAFNRAGAELGVIPRLLAAPGYTHQTLTGVTAINVTAAGSGYTSAPTVALSGGGGSGATATAILGTDTNAGKVVGFTITNPGSGYTTAPTVAFSGGGGTGAAATAVTNYLANGACVALASVAETLLAHAVVDGPAGVNDLPIKWRQSLNSQRLVCVLPNAIIQKSGAPVTVPLAPAILGIAVRRDHEFGGLPFHSWANQPVKGVIGPSRQIRFSLTDDGTDGQLYLSNNLGVMVRGEMGVENSIGGGGFIFIGTDNAGDDDLWRFYSVTRGRDYIHLAMLRTLRTYLGRFNMTGQTVQAVINSMNAILRDLKAQGAILGYELRFPRDLNTVESFRQGRLTVQFSAEEAPVLRLLKIRSGRYAAALDTLLDDLLQQVGVITG